MITAETGKAIMAKEQVTGVTNSVVCLNCGMIVASRHVYDYQTCDCYEKETGIAVDGGREYTRRGFFSGSHWIEADLSEWKGGQKIG